MTLAPSQSVRTANRYVVDQFLPGVNDAADNAYRSIFDLALTLRETQDLFNAELSAPMRRIEHAVGLLEMKQAQIDTVAADGETEYLASLIKRIRDMAARLEAAMETE